MATAIYGRLYMITDTASHACGGTGLEYVCAACYRLMLKTRKHPDFSGPRNLAFSPLQPGERCAGCGAPFDAHMTAVGLAFSP